LSDWQFVRRVLIVFGLAALLAALWALSDIVLLIFGAVLASLGFRGLSEPLSERTGLPRSWALLVVVIAIVTVVVATTIPFAAPIVDQTNYVFEKLPAALNSVASKFNLNTLIETIKGSAIGSLVVNAFAWGSAIAAATTSLVLVLFGGVYGAAAPETYRQGFLKLFPDPWRDRIRQTMEDANNALTRWLRAQVVAMAIVGTMMGVGMWLLGVPSPIALGLISALTEFVPIIGPIIGTVPAVLVASTQSWDLAMWALGVAIAVQQIENYLIMPFLVGRIVALPAAVGLFAVVAIGVIFGPIGLILGYPLAIVIDVAVRRLYLTDTLGETVD